ncbi:hypothetical protein KP509_28G020700 [Ceratopteris richardii]|nr:hypothetical protein KP509_28G020700 [Ceratopteris richardii]
MHGRGATLLSKENAEVEPNGDGSVNDKVCSDEREAINVKFISRLQENTTAHVPESNNDAQNTVANDMDNACENVDIKDTQTYSKDITEVTADHALVDVGHDLQEKNGVSEASGGGKRGMHVYEAAGERCSTSKPESLYDVQKSEGIHSAFEGDEIYNNICSRGDKCDGVATKEREICSENTKAVTADDTAAGEVNDLKEEERASQNGLSVYSRAGESCCASEDENVYNDKQYEGPHYALVNEKFDILKCPEDNGCDDASIQDREVDSEDMKQVTNNHTAVGEFDDLKEEERASEFVDDNERDVSDYGATGESCSASEDGKAYKDKQYEGTEHGALEDDNIYNPKYYDDDRHADVSTEGREIYSEETREVAADRTAVQKVDDLKEDEIARDLNEVSERNVHVYDSAGESFAALIDARVYNEKQYGQSYNALEDDDIYNHKCSEGDECEGVGAKERESYRLRDTREMIADHSAAEEANDLKEEETTSKSYENTERDVHVLSAARESRSASEDKKVFNNIQYEGTDGNLEADKVYDLKFSEADGRKDIGTEVDEVYNKDTTELRADHTAGEVDDLKEEETAKDPDEGSERGMHVCEPAGESSSASEDESIYNDKQNRGTQVPLEGDKVYDCKCFHIDGYEDVDSKGRDIYSRDTRAVSVNHTTAEVDDLKKGEWVNDSYKYSERGMNVLSGTGRKSCSGSEDENVHIDKQYEETHSADQAYDLKCHENHECEDVEAEDTAIYSNDTREVAANHTVVREADDLKEKQRTSDPNEDSERHTLVYDSAGELYSASENERLYADKQYEETHLVAEGDEVYDSKCSEDDECKRAGTKEGGIDTRDTTEVLADHTTAREMDHLKEDERPRDLINEDSERGMHVYPGAAAESFITSEDKTQNDKQGCCGTHGASEDDKGQICSEDDECEGVGTAERKIHRKDTAVAKVDNRNEERVSDTKKDNEIGMHVHEEEDYCTGSEDGRLSNYKHFEGSHSGLKEDEDSSHLCFEHNGSEEVCISQRQSYSNGSSELITDHSAKEDDDFEEGERRIDYIGSEDRGVHNHIGSEDRGMDNNEQSEDEVSIFEGEEAHNHLCSEAEDIHSNKPLGVNNTLSEEQDGNTRTSKAMSSSNVNSVEEIGTFIDVVREIALDGFKNVQSGDEYGESRLDVLAGNEIEKMNSGVIASVSQNDEVPNLAHSKDEVLYMDRKFEGTNTVFEDEKIHYDKFSEKQHARVHTSKIVNCSVVDDKEIKACADIAREAGIWSFEDVQKCEKVVEKDVNEDLEKGSMTMRSKVEARPYVVLNEDMNAMIDPMSNREDRLLDCILDEGIDENLYDNTGTEVDLVVGEFLDMLGKGNNPASSDYDSDLDSPRAQLLKEFEEKNVLKVAFGLDFDDTEFLQDATSTDEDVETHLQSALQAETEEVVVKQPDFISNHSNASTKTEHEVVLFHHTSFQSRETKDELDQTFSSERFKGEFAYIDHSAPYKWMPKQLQSGWNQVSSIEQLSEQSVYLDDVVKMGAKSENQGEHFLTEGINMELSVQHGANLHLNGTERSHLNVDYGMVREKESALLGDTTKLMFKDEQEQNFPDGNIHFSSKERNTDEDWDFEHDEELVSFLEAVEPETRRPTAQIKQIGSRAKMLEDTEIEALMEEWGLDEEDIMSSPPIPMRRV